MRQYAVLKNVVRGVNFGVVVKSHGNLKFYGWSEKGIEWSRWANDNKADLGQLPANIAVGEFKGLSDEMMKSIILDSSESVAAGESVAEKKILAFNLGSERFANTSKYPSFVDAPIYDGWASKTKSINFKAKNFRKEVAHNEISLRVRMHELAFDNLRKEFVAKPNKATKTYVRSEIRKKMSRGAERKFGQRIVGYVNASVEEAAGLPSIKRAQLGPNTKEILSEYTKASLGRTIGRAVGSAARGMTPNRGRGRARGAASRFVSGVLDPRKRRDVDGDGMIFDGTWREMPDPSRFVQKPDARPTDGRIGYNPLIDTRATRNRENASRALRETLDEVSNLKPERRRGLRSGDAPPPRAAAAVQMEMDARNSRLASKITYDPQDQVLEVTYRGTGKTVRFRNVPYESARQAGASSSPDRFIRSLEEARENAIQSQMRSSGRAGRRALDSDKTFAEFGNPQRLSDEALESAIAAMNLGGRDTAGKMAPYLKERNNRKAKFGKKYPRQGGESSKPNQTLRSSGRKYENVSGPNRDRLENMRDTLVSGELNNPKQLRDQLDKMNSDRDRISKRRLANIDELRELPQTPENKRKRANLLDEIIRDGQEVEYLSAASEMLSEHIDNVAAGRDVRSLGGDRNKPRALRSSTLNNIIDSAEGANENLLVDALRKHQDGKPLSKEEKDYLLESLRNILDNNPDITEDERVELIDLENAISGRNRTTGLRSSTLSKLADSAEGANEDELVDALRKIQRDEPVTGEQRDYLLESLRNILDNNPDITEDERVELIDLENKIRRQPGSGRTLRSSGSSLKPKPSKPPRNSDGSLVNVFDDFETEELFKQLGQKNKIIKQLENWLNGDGPFPKSLPDWYRDRDRARKFLSESRQERIKITKALKDRGYESPNEARKEFGRSKKKPAGDDKRSDNTLPSLVRIPTPEEREDDNQFVSLNSESLNPTYPRLPNGYPDFDNINLDEMTDEQLIGMLVHFAEINERPFGPRSGRTLLNELNSGDFSKLRGELQRRGYSLKLGEKRRPKYYGDYAAGDRYWTAKKTRPSRKPVNRSSSKPSSGGGRTRRDQQTQRLIDLLNQEDQRPKDGRIGYNPLPDLERQRERDEEIRRILMGTAGDFYQAAQAQRGGRRSGTLRSGGRNDNLDGIREMADGAGEMDLVNIFDKVRDDESISPDERKFLRESIRDILDNNPDITEDERVVLIDLDKKLANQGKRTLRSSELSEGQIGRPRSERRDAIDYRTGGPEDASLRPVLSDLAEEAREGGERQLGDIFDRHSRGDLVTQSELELAREELTNMIENRTDIDEDRKTQLRNIRDDMSFMDGQPGPIEYDETEFGGRDFPPDPPTLRSSGKRPNNKQSRARDAARAEATDTLKDNAMGGADWDSPFRRAWMKLGIGLRPGTADRFSRASLIMSLFHPGFINDDKRINEVLEKAGFGQGSRSFQNIKDMLDAVRRGEMPREEQLKAFVSDAVLMGGVIRGRDGKSIDKQVNNDFAGVVEAYIIHQNPRLGDGDGAPTRSLRSSGNLDGIREMSEGAGEMDFVDALNKIRDGKIDDISDDQMEYLRETVRNILRNNPDITEDERVALLDLENQIKPNRSTLRSGARGRPTQQQLSSRRMLATTERAARPRGTSLRSSGGTGGDRTPAPKAGSGRGPGVGPGGKYGHGAMERKYGREKTGTDGELWDSLTPEQKKAVEEALLAERKTLEKKLKGFFNKYWAAATKKGAKKQGVVAAYKRGRGKAGGRYEKRPDDDPLDATDVSEMLLRLDQAVANGDIEKFDADKNTRDLKLQPDGSATISNVKSGYKDRQQAIDDMQTVLNMIEDGDFSALEHLHPTIKKKIAKVIRDKGGEVPKGWEKELSTVARYAGGEERRKAPDAIDMVKERGISEKKKDKRLSLFQRLRRMDPERERQIELRAARRAGGIREGIALDPEQSIKKRKLRARAMKRRMISRFKKSRNPDDLASDSKARKDAAGVVKTDPATNKVEISDGFVDLMHALDNDLIGIQQKKRKGATERDTENEHKTLLKRVWENAGYAETPTTLTDDEVKSLVKAGWQVIVRGTGHEKVDSESYVERFLHEEGRFIPGQGGSAYGIGEYFAYPGQWTGYHGSGPDDRHTIVALIPPTADVMMASEISREHRRMGELTGRINDRFKVLGGRDAVKARTPEELVAEIDAAVPDLASDATRSGQIVKQLRDRLEALSKMPNDTPEQKAKIAETKEKLLSTLDYLERYTKQRSAEMIAPIIGVDVIDANNGESTGSPMLVHNRTILAAFQNPATLQQAEAMIADENGRQPGKVWTKWKRTPTDGDTKPRRLTRRRTKPATQPAPQQPAPQPANQPTPPAPASSVPNTPGGPVNTDTWNTSTPPTTGSNPAMMLTAPDGTRYYTKLRKSGETAQQAEERMQTEVLASKLYALAGVPVADLQMGTNNGDPVMMSRMIQVRMPRGKADNDAARDNFVVDAWLANWDAPLNDNIQIDSNGNAVRMDVGGSLDFRAQGQRKGSGRTVAFGNNPGEMNSMQKQGTYDFTGMDAAELKKQAQRLSTITNDDIRKTVAAVVTDPARAAQLAATLIARRDAIVQGWG